MATVSTEESIKASVKSFLIPYRMQLDIQSAQLDAITCKELDLVPYPQLSPSFWKRSLFAPCKYRSKSLAIQ